MAERRMFAKSIVDSDAFLDMPLSAQALYFHLSMRADDEGFVGNPRRIKAMIGASEDDLKLLILKRFVLTFQSGVLVIKHWRIHNYIQNDRWKPTTYIEERATLQFDGKKAYTEKSDTEKLDTECIQDVSKLDTQDSIDKNSIDKINNNSIRFINKTHTCSNCSLEEVQNVSNGVQNEPNELYESNELNQDQVQIETEENNNQVQVQDQKQEETSSMKDDILQNLEPFLDHESSKDKRNDLKKTRELFDVFWSQYPRKQGRQKCLNWFEVHLPSQELVDTMIKAIYVQKQSDQWRKNNGMYIPMPITWLHQARWEDEMEISLADDQHVEEPKNVETSSEDEVQALLKELEELDEQAKRKHGCD